MIVATWSERRIGDLASMGSGGTPPSKVSKYYGGGVPWVSIADMTASTKYVRRTAKTLSAEGLAVSAAKLYEPGVILYAMYASLGECAIAVGSVSSSQAILGIQPGPSLDREYLYYYLESIKEQIKTIGQQGTQSNLNAGMVRDLRIQLPPLDEQRKISTALSDADDLIATLERLIAKKQAIKQGMMQQLLTGRTRLPGFASPWSDISLGKVARIKTGFRNNQDKQAGGKYPFFVRSATVERIDSYSYDCEAILVPGDGGIGSIFHYINGKFEVHQRVYKISGFTSDASGRFVYYSMRQYFGAHAMENSVKATVDSLRLPTFENFQLRLPSRDEQDAIVSVLNDAEAEVATLEGRLTKARTIKTGMMQHLLTGRTRLRVEVAL